MRQRRATCKKPCQWKGEEDARRRARRGVGEASAATRPFTRSTSRALGKGQRRRWVGGAKRTPKTISTVCLTKFLSFLTWLHPHSSLIQFALICGGLHLSLRAGEQGGSEGCKGGAAAALELAHCLLTNQGHWGRGGESRLRQGSSRFSRPYSDAFLCFRLLYRTASLILGGGNYC